MKQELSILIPAFNYDCTPLVEGLCLQAVRLGIRFEVVVAEDGSTLPQALQANARIAGMEGCRYLQRGVNIGRARIRNLLAQESRYPWLLFLDCDMELPDDRFLQRYLECQAEEVIDGGFSVKENPALWRRNLRYTYEWSAQSNHTADKRAANPYRCFRTTNFMIRRDLMLDHPFDERFLHYGYEDVLFGKQLKRDGIGITHIDNAMVLVDVEPNDVFLAKTEESLRTLAQFSSELRGYSQLLTFVNGIHLGFVRWLLRLSHRLLAPLERRNLCGPHPSLRVFNIYKVGYFLQLSGKK